MLASNQSRSVLTFCIACLHFSRLVFSFFSHFKAERDICFDVILRFERKKSQKRISRKVINDRRRVRMAAIKSYDAEQGAHVFYQSDLM